MGILISDLIIIILFIALIYVTDLKIVGNIFYATGLPLVVTNSKFTLGLHMFQNKIVFGKSNKYFNQEVRKFDSELQDHLSSINRENYDSLISDGSINDMVKDISTYYNHAHISRWFESEFAKSCISQKFTLGGLKEKVFNKYNNFGDLPYDVGKFDLKPLGSCNEGLLLHRHNDDDGQQYIMNNPVSVDCAMFSKNYDFSCLTEEELFNLKINLEFSKKYLPDIMNNLEDKYGELIKILENSKNIIEFNRIIMEFNKFNVDSHIINIAQVPMLPESLGFREIPIEYILEIANNTINNIT